MWDTGTGLPHQQLAQKISLIGLDPARELLYAMGDRNLQVWDPETGQLRHEIKHPVAIKALVHSQDGSQIATCHNDGIIRIIRTNNWEIVRQIQAPESRGDLFTMTFGPGGDLFTADNKAVRRYLLPQ